MPSGSTVVISYDGTDITSHCVFAECTFEGQMAAVPGTFQVAIKDPNRTLDFSTGKELTLDVDGVRLYGGYVMQVSKTYFFPAADTTNLTAVKSRKWVLEGVDYNVLLDKRYLRNTANYTQQILGVAPTTTDASLIRTYFGTYFDIPSGFDFSSATYILPNHTYTSPFNWPTQGTLMRTVLDLWGAYGSVFWIDATKQFNFMPVQDTAADWGFSDKPNNNAIGVGVPTRGFSDGEFTEDATSVINDALVWGGSEWAAGGDVVFDRETNSGSITAHNRWQTAEVRVGDANYKIQAEVTARARVIVNGNESGTFAEGSQGLVNPERQFRCTWYSTHVPKVAGVPVHLKPAQVVPIELWVFSADGGTTPFEVTLPLRSITITFPGLDPNGNAYVQFEGLFGVLMSDPKWLWAYLREGRTQIASIPVTTSANNYTISPPYGAQYQGEPSPAPNNITNVFTIPFGYIAGTTYLYVNGLLQEPSAYTESDPGAGEITLTFVPQTTDSLLVKATLSG